MTKQMTIGLSLLVAGVLISLAIIFSAPSIPSGTGTPEEQVPVTRDVTAAELAAGTGVNDQPCLVAVDGIVYEISNSVLWILGIHTPTDGKIRCGFDHSESILSSPHGKTKLKYLDIIGPLVP